MAVNQHDNDYYHALKTNTYTVKQMQAMVDAYEDSTARAWQQKNLNDAIAQFNIDNATAPGASNPTAPQPPPIIPQQAKSNTLLYVGIAAVVAYLAFKG